MGNRTRKRYHLGGGFNPFEKKGSSNWISKSPGIRVKFQKKQICETTTKVVIPCQHFFSQKVEALKGKPTWTTRRHDVPPSSPRWRGTPWAVLPKRRGPSCAWPWRTWRRDFKGRGRPLVGTVGLISPTLRITGPCYKGVWMSIAGVWDLQTTSFEIPWFLGHIINRVFVGIITHTIPYNFFLLPSNRTSKYSLALRISDWTLQWKGWFETV